MDLRLERKQHRIDGIFGEILDSRNRVVAYTLEHSYDLKSKIPAGVYQCVLGTHALHNGIPFQAYELQNVPGHTNILIHMGNYNNDSEGCILVGEAITPSSKGQMVTNSRTVFAEFMKLQKGAPSFTLTVVD